MCFCDQFFNYLADMAVALHVKYIKGWKQDSQAGEWGFKHGVHWVPHSRTFDPISNCLPNVVSIGSLWNELPDVASHSAPEAVVQSNNRQICVPDSAPSAHPLWDPSAPDGEEQRCMWVRDEPGVRGAGLSERILTERKEEMCRSAHPSLFLSWMWRGSFPQRA